MKTISEIQAEIREISVRLNEIFYELGELKPTNIEEKQVDFEAIERIAKAKPMLGHKLAQADAYQKKMYLTGLAIITQFDSAAQEDKLAFLWRIAAGSNFPGHLDELVQGGLESGEKLLDEFLQAITDVDLKHLFILDSLIISNLSGEMNNALQEYISEISGCLGLERDEIRFLAQLAACILEQCNVKYQKLVGSIPQTIDIVYFYKLYLRSFASKGVISNTNHLYCIYGVDLNTEIMKSIKEAQRKSKNLLLKSMKIDLNVISADILIESFESVAFDGCEFTSSEFILDIKANKKISLLRCKFKCFEKRLGNFAAASVEIAGCKFEKCYILNIPKLLESSEPISNIKFNNVEKFSLQNSEFIACGRPYYHVSGGSYYYKGIRVLRVFIMFDDCTLMNNFEISKTKLCKCGNYDSLFWGLPENFQQQSYFSGCEITDYDGNKESLAKLLYSGL